MPFDPLSPPPADNPPPRWRRPGCARLPHPSRLPQLSRLPRAGLTVGLAAGLALGGAGIAFAASSATSSTPTSTSVPSSRSQTTLPKLPGLPRGPLGRIAGPGAAFGLGRLGGLGGVVHGQVTVRNGSGYRTVELQLGKVTAVSSSSISVASSDGYSHTYTVVPSTVVDSQAGGIGSVAKGDQVNVVASTESGKDTALSVLDTTKVGDSWKGFGFGKGAPAPPAPQTPGTNA